MIKSGFRVLCLTLARMQAAYKKIRFVPPQRNMFFAVAKKRVDAYFVDNNLSKYANATMVVKTITLLGMYIVPFVLVLLAPMPFGVALLLWALMGFGLAGIGMSIMHDANHGAYSSNATPNNILGYTLAILGAGVLNWKIQHNVLHHNYTNISGVDEDINDKYFLKLSPHKAANKLQRGQHIYAFLLYAISTLYWVFYKDFPQYLRYVKNGLAKHGKSRTALGFILLLLHKLVYLFIMLAAPVLFFGLPFYQVLIGFVVMHLIAGLTLTVIFQLAHTIENTTHPLPNDTGVIANDWAIHQMQTTVNFAPNNKLLSWYCGGLNYQVEHHLFPSICHVHYPAIAAIVKQTAAEHNIPYLQNESFTQAFKLHIATLRRFGHMVDLDEAIV